MIRITNVLRLVVSGVRRNFRRYLAGIRAFGKAGSVLAYILTRGGVKAAFGVRTYQAKTEKAQMLEDFAKHEISGADMLAKPIPSWNENYRYIPPLRFRHPHLVQ
jgi:hypothetical protein